MASACLYTANVKIFTGQKLRHANSAIFLLQDKFEEKNFPNAVKVYNTGQKICFHQ